MNSRIHGGVNGAGGAARSGGFTLIELLLATALIALIMAMAYGGFRASVRVSASGGDLIEETNRMRVVHEFVRRQIAQARPLIMEETDETQVRFQGERDRLRLVAPMPGYLGFGGPYVQEFRFERGLEGMDLVFAFAMLNGYQPGDLDARPPVTLIENVDRVAFEFLGFDEDGEVVVWNDFWDFPETLPLAVSFDLELDRDNGLAWPELVTPVMTEDAGSGPQRPRSVEDIRANMLGIDPNRR